MIHVGEYSKSLYPKEAVLKAAYNYIDKYYLHIEMNEFNYILSFTPKYDEGMDVVKEFENELLSQSVRFYLSGKTKAIRELIIARAMASTIIMDELDANENEVDAKQFDDSIDLFMKDWFEENENQKKD